RLFGVDVEPALHRLDGQLRMNLRRDTDDDRIEVEFVKHLAVVGVHALSPEETGVLLRFCLVQIANRLERDGSVLKTWVNPAARQTAGADKSDFDKRHERSLPYISFWRYSRPSRK